MQHLPPPPSRPPPGSASSPAGSLVAEASKRRLPLKPGIESAACAAIVAFEFTHTHESDPGPVNELLACRALSLWHGPYVCQRRSVPILAPPRLLRALRQAEKQWPCLASRAPHLVDFEGDDSYGTLVEKRSNHVGDYSIGVAASICRALLRCGVWLGRHDEMLQLAIVTHDLHAPRWACLLEHVLECKVFLPCQLSAETFALWGLDPEGFWSSDENPQWWTRSADAFVPYELERFKAFEDVGRCIGSLWRQRTWTWFSTRQFHVGQYVWALFDGEWHAAKVTENDSTGPPGLGADGVWLEWLTSAGQFLAASGVVAAGTANQSGVVRRTRHRWPRANLQLMRRDDSDFFSKLASACVEHAPAAKNGYRCLPTVPEECEAWTKRAAPAWRLQKCIGCGFAVTTVAPQFCCWKCAEASKLGKVGTHGPACKRLVWKPLHRQRSLSI